MSERMVSELAERLRHHLDQLCDKKNCVTPDHQATRDALIRADMWLRERIAAQAFPEPVAYFGSRGG